jgi:hypothetical protein
MRDSSVAPECRDQLPDHDCCGAADYDACVETPNPSFQ